MKKHVHRKKSNDERAAWVFWMTMFVMMAGITTGLVFAVAFR